MDEQGSIFGYKILIYDEVRKTYISPVYSTAWVDGVCVSICEPTFYNKDGIYALKRKDDSKLNSYKEMAVSLYPASLSRPLRIVTVRVALWGTVIETEKGLRGWKAKIIEEILPESKGYPWTLEDQ